MSDDGERFPPDVAARASRGSSAVGICRVCGELFDRRRYKGGKVVGMNRETQTCPRHRWLRRAGEVLVDKETPYRRDVACQLFVATFRGGATLDAIAEALGVSRERVRQIENEAKAKLQALGLAAFGVDPDDPEERRDGVARHDVPGGLDEGEDEEAADVDGADDARAVPRDDDPGDAGDADPGRGDGDDRDPDPW